MQAASLAEEGEFDLHTKLMDTEDPSEASGERGIKPMPSQSQRAKASGIADRITEYCCFLQSVNTGACGSGFIVELKDLQTANLLALNWKKRGKSGKLQTDYALVTSHDTIPGLSLSDLEKNHWKVSCQGINDGDEQILSKLVCGVISCCGPESLLAGHTAESTVTVFRPHPGNASCDIQLNITIIFLNKLFEELLQESPFSPPVIPVSEYLEKGTYTPKHQLIINTGRNSRVSYSDGVRSVKTLSVVERQHTSEHGQELAREIIEFERFQKLESNTTIEICHGSPVYLNPDTSEPSVIGVYVGRTSQKGEQLVVTFHGILRLLQGGLIPVLSVLHCLDIPKAWVSRWGYLVTPHIDQMERIESCYLCEVLHFLLRERLGTPLVKLSVDLVDVDNEAALDLLCALFKHFKSVDNADLNEAVTKLNLKNEINAYITRLCKNVIHLLELGTIVTERTSLIEKCLIFYNLLLDIKFAEITEQILQSSENLELLKRIQQRYGSEPKFSLTDLERRMREICPAVIKDGTTKNAVQLFAKQVVLILHTCNPREYWAALERLKPPTTEDQSKIQDRPIFYPQDDSVIGWFASYRAAVVRTEQGDKGRSILTKALTEAFPNVQVIIEAGIAHANDQKYMVADVLIPEECTLVGSEITSDDPHQQIDPNVIRVFKDAAKDWSDEKKFICANDSRTSVAHIGHVVCASSFEILRKLLIPNSIGGEIDGWVLFELKKTLNIQDKKDVQIIIISCVSEYQDLTMGDKWQWTAAKAAMDCIHYCLMKSGGIEFNANSIQRKGAREYHYEVYQQALKKEAAIPLKYLKVLFFGPPRTGKTSMRRRLVGEIQNLANEPIQASTGTAECYDVIVKEDKINTSTAVITESTWSSIKVLCSKEKNTQVLDEELRLLYQLISQTSHRFPIENKPLVENRSSVPPNENRPSKENESLNENKSPVRDRQQIPVRSQEKVSNTKTTESTSNTSTPWIKRVGGRECEFNAEDIEKKEINKEFEAFDNILRTSEEGQIKDLLDGTILMNMVDTGGQPAFLEMLPALTMGPALYLIFFRLNQELKKTYEIQYVSKDNEEVPLGDSSYTVEEVIFQALSSIACFSCGSPEKADMLNPSHAAILVGTHKDKLESDTEAKIKDKDDALQKNVDKILKRDIHEIDKNFVHRFSVNQLIFAIDNMTGDEAELIEVRKRLQEVIEQMFHANRFPIPASWLMFGIFIRKMGKCTMSLSQCRMIGKRLNLTDTNGALWFLHHCVGVLMHFPEVKEIKDMVICNPQIVFDSVTDLILDSFKIKWVHDSICDKFKEDGQFRFKDIQKIAEKREGDSLPLPNLVKLLEYLNIIAPIQSEGSSLQSDAYKEEVFYFMPAVLKSATEEELHVKQDPRDPAPLMICFKCGFVPVGVFCAKIASLVSQGWKLYNDHDHILCKNRATFRICNGTYDITLISMPKWFEIHIARIPHSATPDRALQEICQQEVLEKVCNVLDEVISKMSYKQVFSSDKTPYELGFKCPLHDDDDHLAINKPKDGEKAPSQSSKSLWFWLHYKEKSVMMCQSENIMVKPSDQSLVWFGKAIPVNITRHPQDQSVTTGANINFHIEATGYDILQFQWQKDGKDIDIGEPRFSSEKTEGASTLHIQCVKQSDEGRYRCLVKNPVEQSGKSSYEAKLAVFDPPDITQHPKDQSVATGADITFKIVASGDDLQFQWQKDGDDIGTDESRLCSSKPNTSTLQISCVKKSDQGHYRCLVKNPVGQSGTSSYEAKLAVCLKLDETNVVNVLHEARFSDGDWENLGQQLMIKHHALRTIRTDHPGQSSLCMSDTISQWLNNDLEASWEKLAEAVIKVEGYGEANAHTVRQKAGICAAVASEEKRVSSQSQPISTADTHRAAFTPEAESSHPQPSTCTSTTVGSLGRRKQKPSEDEDVGVLKKPKLEEGVRSPQERKRERTGDHGQNVTPSAKRQDLNHTTLPQDDQVDRPTREKGKDQHSPRDWCQVP